jgi:hypothetical protein
MVAHRHDNGVTLHVVPFPVHREVYPRCKDSDLFTLKTEAKHSSETLLLMRTTRRHPIPEDSFHHCYYRESAEAYLIDALCEFMSSLLRKSHNIGFTVVVISVDTNSLFMTTHVNYVHVVAFCL